MSQKHRKFSPEFKTKVVLELLEGNTTINEIASKPEPSSLYIIGFDSSAWFEIAVSIKKYKEEIKEKESQIDALSKALGQTTFREGFKY